MEFIRLMDPDKKEHISNEAFLEQIGYWHNLTPKLWIKDHQVSPEDIQETIESIMITKREKLCLIAALDKSTENLVGFIWAYKQPIPEASAMIVSLYVEPDHRRKGIAGGLKIELEKWCISNDIKQIQTTVHYKNDKMIRLNQAMGYEPGMIFMTKHL